MAVKTRWSARLAGKPVPDYTDGGKYNVIDLMDRQLVQSHARAEVGPECVIRCQTRTLTSYRLFLCEKKGRKKRKRTPEIGKATLSPKKFVLCVMQYYFFCFPNLIALLVRRVGQLHTGSLPFRPNIPS